MSVLVITEPKANKVSRASLATIAAATELGSAVNVLVLSSTTDDSAQYAASIEGVDKVINAVNPCFEHPLAEDICALVLSLADQYTHIIAPANTFGKNVMPRIAAKLDCAQISDIIKVISDDTFVRPIYAGNALITVQSSDQTKIITVRPTAFTQAPQAGKVCQIEPITYNSDNKQSKFISAQVSRSERPELGSAKIVVSGGRGLKDASNFKLIENLADQLGAAVGASRAAVDAGFISNEYQVGQTGKVVAPDLYIAIGISGAIQHLAGISDSKVIVAINKDPDAPIFDIADYGLQDDFFEVLPVLQAELEKLGYTQK